MINRTIQTMLPRRSPQGFLIQIMIISRTVVSMQCSSPSRTIKFMALHRGEALVDGFPVKPMSARGAVPCLGRQDVLSQAFCTGSYPKPLLESIVQFCRDKTSKRIRNFQNLLSFHPPIPGRTMMVLLRNLPENNVRGFTLSMVVSLRLPQ